MINRSEIIDAATVVALYRALGLPAA